MLKATGPLVLIVFGLVAILGAERLYQSARKRNDGTWWTAYIPYESIMNHAAYIRRTRRFGYVALVLGILTLIGVWLDSRLPPP